MLRSRAFGSVLLVWSALLSQGCDRGCNPEPRHCDGNTVRGCVFDNPKIPAPLRINEDCGDQVCVEVEDSAYCAESAEPSEECFGFDLLDDVCQGNDILECRHPDGFVANRTPCPAGTTCLDVAEGEAACASEIDYPGCEDDFIGIQCAGKTLQRCNRGHLIEEFLCEHECLERGRFDRCLLPSDGECIEGSRIACERNALVVCDSGSRVHTFPCPGTCVVEEDSLDGPSASCVD